MASEDLATESQIKRLYAVLHSLGIEPKAWKKERNIASYAKLTRGECSNYIDELDKIEAEKKAGSDSGDDELQKREGVQEFTCGEPKQPKSEEQTQEEFDTVSEIAMVMRLAVRESNIIVEQEIDGGGLPEATKANLVERLAVTIFIEARKRGL
jgi:hypothetical protein